MSGNSVDFIWPGLGSYTESEQGLFFGRDDEIVRLSETIEEENLCTVYGPSGAGKTSLLLAGVFPRLRKRGWLPIYLRLDHGASAPSYVRQIIAALTSAADGAGLAVAELCAPLTKDCDETLWEWMHRHVFLNGCKNPVRPVLLIDQFEEIFTLGAGDERVRDCFTELGDLCTNNIPQAVVDAMADSEQGLSFPCDDRNWRMVLSLREDFLPRLEEVSPDHPVFRQNRISVNALTRDQALSAVIGPGREIVSETVARSIVDIVGRSATGRLDKVEPALLSLFCSRLDITRRQKGLGRITQELLAASEKDILASFYVETTGRVSKKTMSLLEDRLLTTGGYRSSWAVEDAKLEGVRQSEIDTLVNARLLHVDHRGGVSWLEFSHDILTAEARSSRVNRRLLLEKARTRRMAGLLVSLVVLLAASAVSVWHLFYREYAPCYLRTVKVFGRIQGVGEPLSESDKRQASVYFKLLKRGRYSFRPHAELRHLVEESPVYRMEAIDGLGKPTIAHGLVTYLWDGEEIPKNDDDKSRNLFVSLFDVAHVRMGGVGARVQSSDELKKVCAWEYRYGRDGRLMHEFGVDGDGKTVWGCTYAPCTDSNPRQGNTVVHFVDARGFPVLQSTNQAEYVEITYDEKTGYERRLVYYDAGRNVTKGKDGAQCKELLWSDRGFCTNEASLGWTGIGNLFTNIIDAAGNTGMWAEFLSNDMVYMSHSFGLNNEPHPLACGILTYRRQYDRHNNLLSQQSFGTNGLECADENGVSRVRQIYRKNGALERNDFYAPPGSGGVWGYANVHHVACWYDERGEIVNQCFYGVRGEPVIGANKAHQTCWSRGTASEKGRTSVEWYLDVGTNEVADGNGVARNEIVYDSNDTMTRVDLYAPKGRGGIWNYTNVHHVVRLYDTKGNETNQCFYLMGDLPVAGNNRAHRTCWEYKTIAGKNCQTSEWYLNERNLEVANANGVARLDNAYDSNGVLTRIDLYAPKGCGGIWNYTNVHHVVQKYDTQGNEVEQRFYGLGDVPVVGNFEVHRIGKSYVTVAGESREVAEWYLDSNGDQMTNRIGVTRGTVDYDSQGRMVQLRGFAPKGRGGIMGYAAAHQFVSKFNASGDPVEKSFFDESGNPVQGENDAHCTRWKHKMVAGKSRQTAEWYLDEWGREVADKNGVARRLTEYDQSGTKTRADLYAPQGRGGIWKYEKVHHVISKYDGDGNEVEMSFWDSNEELTRGKLDAAVLQAEYFAPGKIKNLVFLDEKMQPTFENDSGISRLTVEYGDGNCVCKLELHAVEGGVLTLTGVDNAVRIVAKPVAGKDSYEMTAVDRHGTTVMRKNVAGRISDLLGGFTLQTL